MTELTYRATGVDPTRAERSLAQVRERIARTKTPEVIGDIGAFGGLFASPGKDRVLVATTDGVGTKLEIARLLDKHEVVGTDLVHHCVNDAMAMGAEPLFFLDYYATGRLDVDVAARVIEGIGTGCLQAGCALVGGETAEMPGMYQDDDYDLAGFCVGLVEKDAIIDGRNTRAGDAIIGLASSGPHSNGYSLIRKLLADSGSGPDTMLDGRALHDLLLEPTRIYVRAMLALLREMPVHSIAHITGGGPSGNIPRTLPAGLEAVIDARRWQRHAVFDWLQSTGGIEEAEMYRTFNCGLGMTVCVAAGDADRAVAVLTAQGEAATLIGEVASGDRGVVITR